MRRSGAGSYRLVPGWFKDTLATFVPPEPIAVLRLDGDWYDSTRLCLEALYPAVPPGGLIIIDDYYAWEGCARAVHEYLAQQPGSQDRIRQTPAGVAFIHKDPAA
jgi:O-methyltransferase